MQYFILPESNFFDKDPNSLLTRKQQKRLENDDDTAILSSDRLSGRQRPLTTPK